MTLRLPGQFPYPKQTGHGAKQASRGDHGHRSADLPDGLYLYSPNGRRWKIVVDNAGAITATAA